MIANCDACGNDITDEPVVTYKDRSFHSACRTVETLTALGLMKAKSATSSVDSDRRQIQAHLTRKVKKSKCLVSR